MNFDDGGDPDMLQWNCPPVVESGMTLPWLSGVCSLISFRKSKVEVPLAASSLTWLNITIRHPRIGLLNDGL
jgi:hypothetical protein